MGLKQKFDIDVIFITSERVYRGTSKIKPDEEDKKLIEQLKSKINLIGKHTYDANLHAGNHGEVIHDAFQKATVTCLFKISSHQSD